MKKIWFQEWSPSALIFTARGNQLWAEASLLDAYTKTVSSQTHWLSLSGLSPGDLRHSCPLSPCQDDQEVRTRMVNLLTSQASVCPAAPVTIPLPAQPCSWVLFQVPQRHHHPHPSIYPCQPLSKCAGSCLCRQDGSEDIITGRTKVEPFGVAFGVMGGGGLPEDTDSLYKCCPSDWITGCEKPTGVSSSKRREKKHYNATAVPASFPWPLVIRFCHVQIIKKDKWSKQWHLLSSSPEATVPSLMVSDTVLSCSRPGNGRRSDWGRQNTHSLQRQLPHPCYPPGLDKSSWQHWRTVRLKWTKDTDCSSRRNSAIPPDNGGKDAHETSLTLAIQVRALSQLTQNTRT